MPDQRQPYPINWNTALLGPRVALRRRPVAYSQQDRDDICHLVLDGWPPLDVAAAYGMPLWPDWKHTDRNGIPDYHSAIYDRLVCWLPRYEAAQAAAKE